MSAGFDYLPQEAKKDLEATYPHQWWKPDFSETHPTVTFLMLVLNRRHFGLDGLDSIPVQKHLHDIDKELEHAIAVSPVQSSVRYARFALAALMYDQGGTSLRFALHDVMTDEDRIDLAALLSGIDRDSAS